MKSILYILIFGVFVNLTAVAEDGDWKRGEKLSQTCLGCHGVMGYKNVSPVYNVPKIAGQHARYIVLALQSYKNKQRPHTTMQAQAASLSLQDMKDIAAFFSSFPATGKTISSNRITAGKEKSAVCASCHGDTGVSAIDIYPIIAGQYPSYMVQALKEYRSGERENAIMSGFATNLSIHDIRDLAAYYSSQNDGISVPAINSWK